MCQETIIRIHIDIMLLQQSEQTIGILIIKYGDLTHSPQLVLNQIHDFLGEEHYPYGQNGFEDLKQSTHEFDGLYNYKFMHTIKEGGVTYKKHEVKLTPKIIESINTRFTWINDIVGGN